MIKNYVLPLNRTFSSIPETKSIRVSKYSGYVKPCFFVIPAKGITHFHVTLLPNYNQLKPSKHTIDEIRPLFGEIGYTGLPMVIAEEYHGKGDAV